MILAASWFCGEHCGVIVAGGKGSWQRPSPATNDDVMALIGRPVKYFARMPMETRHCLCAASLALGATRWRENGLVEIGLMAAGFQGCLQADEAYFRDYVTSGRKLGRGNLFIYTLPTSALGAVAIVLTLTGPSLHFHDDALPVASLVRHAGQMVEDREADGMLALWSDPDAAVCLAVGGGGEIDHFPEFDSGLDANPLQLAQRLQSTVRGT